MAFSSREISAPQTVDSLTRKLNTLREQLAGERSRRLQDRLPIWEADLECDAKVAYNEIRRLNGQKADYSFAP